MPVIPTPKSAWNLARTFLAIKIATSSLTAPCFFSTADGTLRRVSLASLLYKTSPHLRILEQPGTSVSRWLNSPPVQDSAVAQGLFLLDQGLDDPFFDSHSTSTLSKLVVSFGASARGTRPPSASLLLSGLSTPKSMGDNLPHTPFITLTTDNYNFVKVIGVLYGTAGPLTRQNFQIFWVKRS